MNGKTQPSSRKDGPGTKDTGEDGGSTAAPGSSAEADSAGGGSQRSGHKVEGAHGKEDHGAPGRRSPANKQGLDGNIQSD